MTGLLILECSFYICATLALLYCFFGGYWTGPSILGFAPSVNLVVAGGIAQEISFASLVKIPGMAIIRFAPDNISASSKGREAMIYLAYIYDFYDSLPDIMIFTHGYEEDRRSYRPFESTVELLDRLDLDAVFEQKFIPFNFKSPYKDPSHPFTENPFISTAFLEHFAGESLPVAMNGSCSQFAVSKDAIHALPRQRYKQHLELLRVAYATTDQAGKAWDYMWTWLFLHEARAPIPFKALCKNWHVCFGSQWEMDSWGSLVDERDDKRDQMASQTVDYGLSTLGGEMKRLEETIEALKMEAVKRGRDERYRERATRNMFSPAVESHLLDLLI